MFNGGGGVETGVFPAFLWAKHAAWLALERHTRRVKHLALSCLRTGEMELEPCVDKRPTLNN